VRSRCYNCHVKRAWVILTVLLLVGCSDEESPEKPDVGRFLSAYNEIDFQLYRLASEASWRYATDINERHASERLGADKSLAAFRGSRYVIDASRKFLSQPQSLSDLEFRQLDKILLLAAESPGTVPAIVEKRLEAESRARLLLDTAPICAGHHGEHCGQAIPPVDVDEILLRSHDLAERRRVWEASRHTGATLKKPLQELRDLRNRLAGELGYTSYFHLQVADYGMTVSELMQLMDRTNRDFSPLYRQLHAYARHRLATRYHQPVPKSIPAHWLTERWGQSWPDLVESASIDDGLRGRPPDWMVRQAERLCLSIGFPSLPASFWSRSDLYPVAGDSGRVKRSRCWTAHIDRDKDVRTLLGAAPTLRAFENGYRELGHAHYDLAYSYHGVPHVLRDGANRAFHEAVGELLITVSRQEPYLRSLGVIAPGRRVDPIERLLDEALNGSVVRVPWAAGAVTRFEYELYERRLPPEQWNHRWWQLVAHYQGVEPPAPRAESLCDVCSKSQLIERPAQYYDYALMLLIRYQLHDYIARKILHQDPHNCNYFGNRMVGRWLWNIMSAGATRPWRQLLREKTGEDLSSRAMLEYFRPLGEYLAKENAGQSVGWE
jgi:peptidyl-dipeptidase A